MENFFLTWKEVLEAEYRTPSPYPDIDLYISPKPEMYVRNYPFESGFYINYYNIHRDPGVLEYFSVQAAIVRYNNTRNGKTFTDEMCKMKLEKIAKWRSNEFLQENHSSILPEAIKQAVETVYDDETDYKEILKPVAQTRRRWYSDRIENFTPKERKAAKARARGELNSMIIRDDIMDASEDYRLCNYNVKPTASFVVDNTSYSKPTVLKHGKDQILSSKENTLERIKAIRNLYPEYNQSQVAKKLKISIRSVNSYWNILN